MNVALMTDVWHDRRFRMVAQFWGRNSQNHRMQRSGGGEVLQVVAQLPPPAHRYGYRTGFFAIVVVLEYQVLETVFE
ncbi:hypothetical protein SAMN06265222_107309 [Neorhodopirellula lusitana]|uniref:Uncharacterized protein n=1 Tax=Neorhodopirellula lusitana TaxID=445327 RepID=A0ABY1QAW9_9BACT|nr:hypothetical protein [Neorhodopirellula lusitana]SMP62387.1 hypothetical protein SAMN06265222_107309 [Neorhodopirellula lusitana]